MSSDVEVAGRKLRKEQDVDAVDAARQFWTFGYDPTSGMTRVGSHQIGIETANSQARGLLWAIYMAAQAVDAVVHR